MASAYVTTVLLTDTLGDLNRALVESPYNAKLKVDLPSAHPEVVAQSIENLIGEPAEDILKISAKTGVGVDGRYDSSAPTKRLYLNAWADWNGDGVWDPDEQIIGAGIGVVIWQLLT